MEARKKRESLEDSRFFMEWVYLRCGEFLEVDVVQEELVSA